MTKITKAETEERYRRLVEEQERSGLSIRAFADAHGIPRGTLSHWRYLVKQHDAALAAEAAAKKRKRARKPRVRKAAEARPQFVPVSVVGAVEATLPPSTATSSPTATAGYEIVLGPDRVLRVPADFDEARVAALVRAVTSC